MALSEVQKKERSEYLEENLKITECSQMKPYAFISYASDNWETVFKSVVIPMQKQYGLQVYADKAFDKVNDKWIVPMLRNVRGSDVVIAFISQSYIESYACFLELLTAVNNKKQIVFVSLGEKLHLGDTTDLPDVERGVKNEILNQGANIATNTNNTSNDIMRAMKSAYTSLSTLLEQDALSKYDISDAFINFFRDASINRKSINDLGAVRRTIKSVSRNVFDKSLIAGPVPAVPQPAPQPEPAEQPISQPEPVEQPISQPEPVEQPISQPEPVEQLVSQPEPAEQPAPQSEPVSQPVPQPEPGYQRPEAPDASAPQGFPEVKKTNGFQNKKKVGMIAGCAVAVLLLIIVFVVGGTKKVTDVAYTLSDGSTGTYTGEWKEDMPNGKGTLIFAEDNENGWESYEGEWKEGERNGQGILKWTSGIVYEGEFVNGEYAGKGTMTWETEDGLTGVYEGDFQNSQRSGKGTVTWKKGEEISCTYEGDFADDWINGYGTYIWPNAVSKDGSIFVKSYEGEVKNGQFDGKGTLTYSDGSVFVGEFVDGKKNGEATYTLADGTVVTENWINGNKIVTLTLDDGTYTGTVSDDKPDGHGTMTYAKDDEYRRESYEGEWKEGKRDGQGTMKWTDGTVYEGEYKDGVINGQGTMKWPDGSFYKGEYKDGKRGGQGVYTYAEDDEYGRESYEGEWKEDKRDGQGTLKWKNGAVFEGEWKEDSRNGQGTQRDADGNVKTGIWNGDEFLGAAFSAPADFTAVKNPDDPTGVKLEWAAVYGATGYQTYIFKDAEHKEMWVDGGVYKETYTSWGSLTDGSTYYFGVRAVKEEDGSTTYSDWSYVTYTHNP